MEKRTLLEARLQQLFYQWLLLPETQHLVDSLKFRKSCGSQSHCHMIPSKHDNDETFCVDGLKQPQDATTLSGEELNKKASTLSHDIHETSSFTRIISKQESNYSAYNLQDASLHPASRDPVFLEPASLEPTSLEPASLEPASLEPASLEPASLEPASLEPASLEPASSYDNNCRRAFDTILTTLTYNKCDLVQSQKESDETLEQASCGTGLLLTTPLLFSKTFFQNNAYEKNTLKSPSVAHNGSSHLEAFSNDSKKVDDMVVFPISKGVGSTPCIRTYEIHASKADTLNKDNEKKTSTKLLESSNNHCTPFHLYLITSNILAKPYKFVSKYSTKVILPNEKQCLLLEDIRSTFSMDLYPNGISLIELENLLKYKLNMSKYLAPPLFDKLKNESTGYISQKTLLVYAEANFFIDDPNRTFFNIISNHKTREYFNRADLQPFLEVILDKLPGLDFLKNEPEYQQRYIQTVATRFFYTLDYDGVGYITLKDLYYFEKTQRYEFAVNSQILDVTLLNDLNELEKPCFTVADIWNSLDASLTTTYERFFFSYENFYVIYYLFCQLDSNNDFILDAQELLKYEFSSRYDQCAFPLETVNRILDVFQVSTVPSQKNSPSKTLTYEDFIIFLMNDEDKTTAQSLTFWFNVVDLNGDGHLTFHEISFFFDKLQEKMEFFKQEPVPLQNLLCQINDIFEKKNQGHFTLSDFIKSRKISGFFFDAILSSTKALAFEYRDPYQARQELNDYPFYSPWDRFALRQYYNLICTDKDYESKTIEESVLD